MSLEKQNTDIVIVGMARTPIGALLGELASLSANELGALAIKAALADSGIKGADVSQVIMGNVLQAGQGQAPARQAALKAGLPPSVGATTVNKMCGSGLESVIMGKQALLAGEAEIVVAGGMESMTQAPHLVRLRQGQKYGHGQIYDHMAFDGLEDSTSGKAMGIFADDIAAEYQFSREDQDRFARQSVERAQNAAKDGAFAREITPVTVPGRKGDIQVDQDELPRKARPEKISKLRPAFSKDGTVTAANASSISDGAAALILMRRSDAAARHISPLARIVGTGGHAHAPARFTTAPVTAINNLTTQLGWTPESVDLWEINEAFAVVPLIAIQELGLDEQRVNIHGGACVLGHPIGATGARLLVTLLSAVEQRDAKTGIATACIGGGEALAIALEREKP